MQVHCWHGLLCCRLEGLHVMSQNVALIREINELRREIKVGVLHQPGFSS